MVPKWYILLIVAYLHASDDIFEARLKIVVSRLKTQIKVTQRSG